VLAFDHRGFGDSGGEPDLFDPTAQLDDWQAAIGFARSLSGVDAGRVATFGSSMGGGNALAAAARGRHLPAVGQPDEPAFINAPDAEAGWRHVVAIGEDSRWRNRVSSRWLLGRPYRPAHHAATLHCPWLVCVGEADRVAKPRAAIAAARRAPKGELRTYPGVGHFDIYDGPEHEAVVADQLDFLRRHLL
jgi:pimeloyl-ACP methyl ester carboxylesterase